MASGCSRRFSHHAGSAGPHPFIAIAQTRDGVRQVRARRAEGEERDRLWSRWAEIDKDLDDFAARRPSETAVVVLEPRDGADPRS